MPKQIMATIEILRTQAASPAWEHRTWLSGDLEKPNDQAKELRKELAEYLRKVADEIEKSD